MSARTGHERTAARTRTASRPPDETRSALAIALFVALVGCTDDSSSPTDEGDEMSGEGATGGAPGAGAEPPGAADRDGGWRIRISAYFPFVLSGEEAPVAIIDDPANPLDVGRLRLRADAGSHFVRADGSESAAPPEPGGNAPLYTTQRLVGFDLVADRAFDEGLPAGSSLDAVVALQPRYFDHDGAPLPGSPSGFEPSAALVARGIEAPQELDVRFLRAPADTDPRVYTLFLSLDDGQMLEVVFDPVAIGEES